jgi:hypothetical protein
LKLGDYISCSPDSTAESATAIQFFPNQVAVQGADFSSYAVLVGLESGKVQAWRLNIVNGNAWTLMFELPSYW